MSETPFSLAERAVLVTGATSQIGRACAALAAEMGARIIATGRDAERLDETLAVLSGSGHASLVADLATPEGRDAVLNAADTVQGVLHVAGRSDVVPVKFSTDELFQESMRVNFEAPVLLTRDLFKRKVIQPGGSIVFVASVAPMRGPVGHAAYAASKGALLSAMRVLAREFAPRKLRVNALCPGTISLGPTDEYIAVGTGGDEQNYPLGYGRPEDVAASAAFLLSDAARWITGTSLVLDGGLTLR